MDRQFKKGDKVKVKETGFKATVYDNEGETQVLVRFNGRHSLDLFQETELELVQPRESVKGHTFERISGLVAPFSLVGFEAKESFNPLRKGTGGTSCDYCGTYIINVYWIQDGTGKKFKVGSECVRHLNDKKLVTIVEGVKTEQARLKREAKRVAKRDALVKEFEDALIVLEKYPHPNAYFASQKKTLADYYKFTRNFPKAIADAKARQVTPKTIGETNGETN